MLLAIVRAMRPLISWWRHRRRFQERRAYMAWDLRERYGAAAYHIARNSALMTAARERRRFWQAVADDLRRSAHRERAGAPW